MSSSSRSSSSRPVSSLVELTSLTPSRGPTWTKVTITGEGFARRNNVVWFGDSAIPHLRSLDGKHLIFRVPKTTIHPCYGMSRLRCVFTNNRYGPGMYDVRVDVNGELSNALQFEIR